MIQGFHRGVLIGYRVAFNSELGYKLTTQSADFRKRKGVRQRRFLTFGRNMNFKSVFGFLALVFCAGFAQASITSFSPAYGSAGETITIQGSGFVFPPGTNIVKFGGVTSPHTFAGSSSSLQATVPSGISIGTVVQISVSINNGPFEENPNDFTIIGTGPYVASFDPVSGNTGTLVKINGAHLVGSSSSSQIKVWFNGVLAPNYSGQLDSVLTYYVPAGVTTGPVTVGRVGVGTNTSTALFYITPAVTNFSPSFGRAGTNIVIRGRNFTNATGVFFNGVGQFSFTVNSANQITTTVPPNATTGRIYVQTPATNYTTSTSNFVVQPLITSFTPNFGRPNTNVTIFGENLWGATNVAFGGVRVGQPTGVTYGQLTTKVPNGATNSLITVMTTNGSFTSSQMFYLPPVISSFTPTNGPEGTVVRIVGSNFLGATAVSFNGMPAQEFTVTNNGILGATVPAGVVTGPIFVTTPFGTTNSGSLLFYAPPIINSFNPTHGLPGTNVTIFGTNFSGVTAVKFNGTNAPFTVQTNGTITTVVPTNAVTGPISLTAPAGTTVSASSFILDYASDIGVTVTAPASVLLGNNFTYVLTITNRSPLSAPGVMLTNLLPGDVSLKSVSKTQGTLVTGGNPITGSLGTIPAFSKATVTLTVTPQATGVIWNTATVASDFIDPDLSNNSSSISTTIYVVPVLGIQASTTQIQLSWSVNLSDYVLQSSADLGDTNSWSEVLTPPEFIGDQKVVTEPIGAGTRFYRLKR